MAKLDAERRRRDVCAKVDARRLSDANARPNYLPPRTGEDAGHPHSVYPSCISHPHAPAQSAAHHQSHKMGSNRCAEERPTDQQLMLFVSAKLYKREGGNVLTRAFGRAASGSRARPERGMPAVGIYMRVGCHVISFNTIAVYMYI